MGNKDRDYKNEWQETKTDPELLEAERARLRDWRENHLEKERERSKRKYLANKEYYNRKSREDYAKHPERWREYGKKKRAKHGDRERAQDRAWAAANPEKVREKDRRRRLGPKREQWLKSLRYRPHKHYLAREKYEEIYPLLNEGPCEICGLKGKMKIDHCHKKLVFRGIICDGCNRGLGFFKENPFTMIAAIKYLERLV